MKSKTNKRPSSPKPQRVLDPQDPLHASVESMVAGLSPRERAKKISEFVEAASKRDPVTGKMPNE